jgi:hypothetical protein
MCLRLVWLILLVSKLVMICKFVRCSSFLLGSESWYVCVKDRTKRVCRTKHHIGEHTPGCIGQCMRVMRCHGNDTPVILSH